MPALFAYFPIHRGACFGLLSGLPQVTGGHLVVTARRALAAGEELTICYVDERWPKHQRQTVLRDHYKFECDCPRCDAETS